MAEDHFLVLASKSFVTCLCENGESEGLVGSLGSDVSLLVDKGSPC